MDQPESPQILAMRDALRQAEEAAERRRLAKMKEREGHADTPELSPEDRAVLEATARVKADVEDFEELPPVNKTFDLEEEGNLSHLLKVLDETIPDPTDREIHGDLEIMRFDRQTPAWFNEATEEALPESVRNIPGPLDVKRLLMALIVEVGDVKRTNAVLMEQLTRMEEKVERTNRLLKDGR